VQPRAGDVSRVVGSRPARGSAVELGDTTYRLRPLRCCGACFTWFGKIGVPGRPDNYRFLTIGQFGRQAHPTNLLCDLYILFVDQALLLCSSEAALMTFSGSLPERTTQLPNHPPDCPRKSGVRLYNQMCPITPRHRCVTRLSVSRKVCGVPRESVAPGALATVVGEAFS
jgi:hypothetical protein